MRVVCNIICDGGISSTACRRVGGTTAGTLRWFSRNSQGSRNLLKDRTKSRGGCFGGSSLLFTMSFRTYLDCATCWGAMRGAGAEQLPALVRPVLEAVISSNSLRFMYALGYKLDYELLRSGFSFKIHKTVPINASITISVTSVNRLPKMHALDESVPVTPGLQIVQLSAPASPDNYSDVVAAISSFAEFLAPLLHLSKPGVPAGVVPTASTAAAALVSREDSLTKSARYACLKLYILDLVYRSKVDMKMKTRACMRGGFVLPTLSEENEKDEIDTDNAQQLSSSQTKFRSRQLKTTKIQFRVRKSQKFAVTNDVATVCKNRKLTEHNLEEDVARVAQVEAGLEKETESTHASSGLPTKVEITSKAVAEHIVEDVVAARGVQDDAVWNDLKEETEATKTSSCELDTYTRVTTPPQCISSLCVLPATTVEANWCLSLYGGDAIVVATEHLKGVDSKLRVLIEWHNKSPQFEQCTSSFTALARSIIFQQLATNSASAIYTRLSALCEGGVSPSTIAGLSAQEMREVGISGRKASYLHGLADHFITGRLSDNDIVTMDEEALMAALTAVKGIGVWSVHMFMIFWLHKSDVLPIGDLGVRKGFQKLYQLASLPSGQEMEELAACWRPYRSLGAWYLWRLVDATLPFPAA